MRDWSKYVRDEAERIRARIREQGLAPEHEEVLYETSAIRLVALRDRGDPTHWSVVIRDPDRRLDDRMLCFIPWRHAAPMLRAALAFVEAAHFDHDDACARVSDCASAAAE